MRKIMLTAGLFLLLAGSSGAQVVGSDLGVYKDAVCNHFGTQMQTVDEVMGQLGRIDELPLAFTIAAGAGADPAAVAAKRAEGLDWRTVLADFGLGCDLFHLEIRGFLPSPIFQPIFDKFDADNPAQWASAPLTDMDLLNLANLKFITESQDYSLYRVVAMRDKGRGFTQIHQEVCNLQRNRAARDNTATAGF
ncbi:hypothetical protein KJ682_17940 [bacterium]|nr:hypothetical protein [bacterium]